MMGGWWCYKYKYRRSTRWADAVFASGVGVGCVFIMNKKTHIFGPTHAFSFKNYLNE